MLVCINWNQEAIMLSHSERQRSPPPWMNGGEGRLVVGSDPPGD